MYGTANKKMLNILILKVLKKYSDESHRLTQQKIIKLLEQEYGISCDRRSVKSNILSLKEMGYDISTEDGYYLVTREFEDSELRMLIDSVLFSKSISKSRAKVLIKKLINQANQYFTAKVNYVSNLPELNHVTNKQTMYNLDAINDAISKKKKISFIYNSYGTDFKLHPRRDREYIVNPYQVVANNGRYYLIGNYDKYDDISHYRMDRITNVNVLEEKVKPEKEVKGMEEGLSLPKHMAEHIYMFGGESVSVKMETKKFMMDELVDWFGMDFRILEQKEDTIIVRVTCNRQAMKFWALQYGMNVTILEPSELREDMVKAIEEMRAHYKV